MNSRVGTFCVPLQPENSGRSDHFSSTLPIPRYAPEANFDIMSDRNNLPRANISWNDFEYGPKECWHDVSDFSYEHSPDVTKSSDSYHSMLTRQHHLVGPQPEPLQSTDYNSSHDGPCGLEPNFSHIKTEESSPKLEDMVYLSSSSLTSSLGPDLEHSPNMSRRHTYQPNPTMLLPEPKPGEQAGAEFRSPFPPGSKLSFQRNLGVYPDVTTLINSDSTVNAPMVESEFVDNTICNICHKRFTRDMNRHQGIHREQKRFNCVYPKELCSHRTGSFNRRYDFKKHLLNKHFTFDSKPIKRTPCLRDKLKHWGTCTCGQRFQGHLWIDEHILTEDDEKRCPHLKMV